MKSQILNESSKPHFLLLPLPPHVICTLPMAISSLPNVSDTLEPLRAVEPVPSIHPLKLSLNIISSMKLSHFLPYCGKWPFFIAPPYHPLLKAISLCIVFIYYI